MIRSSLLVALFHLTLLSTSLARAGPTSHAGPSHPLSARAAAPLLPANDPFYLPPAGFESKAPGTILRTREVSVSVLYIRQLEAKAYQLLYRTTSHNGTALATTNTVIVPKNASDSKLVAYLMAGDSIASQCRLSYGIRTGSSGGNSLVSGQTAVLAAILNAKWVTMLPDFEGPDGAFNNGRLVGHSVLDAARAALSFKKIKMQKKARVALAGYSGGAVASAWAAALQPRYAPELNLAGVAAGGTPGNPTDLLTFLDGKQYASFAFLGVGSLIQSYRGVQEAWTQFATPLGVTTMNDVIKNKCAPGLLNLAFQMITSTKYQTAGNGILQDPRVLEALAEDDLGYNKTETPKVPIYLYHSVKDDIVPISAADTLYQNWCANGVKSLYYLRDTSSSSNHVTLSLLGVPSLINFLQDRLNGKPAVVGCTKKETPVPIFEPGALGTAFEAVLGGILTLFSGNVGWNGLYNGRI